jgi:hypothetical protein
MATHETRASWRPTQTSLVAGGLVIAGFLLTGVSWWFLLLAAAGALGPGALRELGALRDKDEFQRRADHRAGYHAFLVTGLLAFVLVAFDRAGGAIEHPERVATLLLATLWFTWLLSTLLMYWGPRRAACRLLIAFGLVWFAFAILTNVGAEWTGWTALLLHPLLAAPFFVLAWLSRRWPRIAGALLLLAAAGLFVFFGGFREGGPALITRGVTYLLFLGPLVASGLALVTVEDDEDEASAESALA